MYVFIPYITTYGPRTYIIPNIIYIYILYYIHMIELLFVLNQNNYDIIYIFLVDNFLHLFSKSILNISYVLTWKLHCIGYTILFQPNLGSSSSICNPLLAHSNYHANRTCLWYSPIAHIGKMFRYDE
jgi:hypothetical protein